jgi:molybdopterin-containing oxidoreductase family membrane subunit
MATIPRTFSRRWPSFTPGFLAWLAFLSLCLVIGLVAAFQVFYHGLVVTNMSDTVPWGLWITIDLSSIALGAGAFTLSAVVYLFGLKRFQPLVRLAVFIGFIGYSSALLTLVADIGRPDRFWHPWVYWNVHSVLWEITWCITIYLAIMLVEFAPVLAETPFFKRWPAIGKAARLLHRLAPALALLGLGISLLHQSSLGATYGIVKSRPIWFKPSMPIMFILSAIAVGPALTMGVAFVLEWVTGKKNIPHDIQRLIARYSGYALMVYGYIKFWDLAAVTYYGRTPAVNQSLYILNQHTPYNFAFWVGEILMGIILPAVLFLAPKYNQKPGNLVLGVFLATFGVIINRWNVTVSGLIVPLSYSPGVVEQSQAAYLPSLVEWGIALGIIGYALLMLTLGARYLPLFEGHEAIK